MYFTFLCTLCEILFAVSREILFKFLFKRGIESNFSIREHCERGFLLPLYWIKWYLWKIGTMQRMYICEVKEIPCVFLLQIIKEYFTIAKNPYWIQQYWNNKLRLPSIHFRLIFNKNIVVSDIKMGQPLIITRSTRPRPRCYRKAFARGDTCLTRKRIERYWHTHTGG